MEIQPVHHQPQQCIKCSPRVPYTHMQFITDSCVIICDPSLRHLYDESGCADIIVCWYPCALVADILCCLPMTFGCYTISKPDQIN